MKHWIGESKGVYLGAYTFAQAPTEKEARHQIEAALIQAGLSTDDLEINEITQDGTYAHVVWNGDY